MIGLIIGPQGSGKGTQAKLISENFKFLTASMGDLLRKESEKKTKRAKEIKKLITKGELVPHEWTDSLAKELLEKEKNVLFDGYPRSLEQAEFLINNYKVDFVIILELSEKETINRLKKRRICTANNEIFSSDTITKQDIEECKKLGGRIVKRIDDSPEAITERLNIYHKKTQPLLKLYKKNKVKVIRVNGEKSINDVYLEITKKLKKIIN